MPQVTISEVAVEEVKKGKNAYFVANVTYQTGRGESKTKKIMSFANPAVFAIAKGAKAGEVYDIAYVPGDEYYNWASMKNMSGGDEAPAPTRAAAAGAAPTGGKVTGSTYETAEERKVKQLLIVKQSSITAALTYLKDVNNEEPASVEYVLGIAQKFVDYVYGNDKTLAEMDNDLPD
jgi:hypothetical protein